MIHNVIKKVNPILLILISILIFKSVNGQTKNCPPLIVPSLTYQIEGQLDAAVGAEVNFQFVSKKCDCNSPLGALCYFWGPTAMFKAQYYPDIKGLDIAGSYGYRFIFLKPEVTAGYTFTGSNEGDNFFHIDPSLGIDLFAGNISGGYSFRSSKIDNKIGAFYFRIAVSPLLFSKKSNVRNLLKNSSKATRSRIRSLHS